MHGRPTGVALVLLAIVRALTTVHPLVMFWWVIWVGILVAVLALWSALYTTATARRPAPDSTD